MKCENCEFFNNALLLCKEKSKIYTKDKKYSCDYYNILKKKVYATLGKERLVLDFSRIVYLYYNIDDGGLCEYKRNFSLNPLLALQETDRI